MKWFVLTLVLSTISCRKDTNGYVKYVPAKCHDTVYYDTEIRVEIVDKSCNVVGCHDTSAAGGLL